MTSQDLRLADYSATDTGIYYLLSSDTMHFPLFPVLSAPSATHREQAVLKHTYLNHMLSRTSYRA